MTGPSIHWRPGRTDARDNATCPPDGNLPDAARNRSHIRDVFGRMNFTDRETVALLGKRWHRVDHAHAPCQGCRQGSVVACLEEVAACSQGFAQWEADNTMRSHSWHVFEPTTA
jgi:catalase (peroxidase I)